MLVYLCSGEMQGGLSASLPGNAPATNFAQPKIFSRNLSRPPPRLVQKRDFFPGRGQDLLSSSEIQRSCSPKSEQIDQI